MACKPKGISAGGLVLSAAAYAWPGGYPVLYFASDMGVLCPKCANAYNPERDSEEQLKPVHYDVHYEGRPEICEHCNAEIESAYGDPETAEAR